jgi:hypothetical protein
VILALLVSCGSEASESGADFAASTKVNPNLTEALDEVRLRVDTLIERVASGAPKKPRVDNSKQQSCNDAEGAPTGEFRSQFGYVVETGSLETAVLLDGAREFFVSSGLAVNTERLADEPPALFAEGAGFSYSAIMNSVGDLVVGGTTPCFQAE